MAKVTKLSLDSDEMKKDLQWFKEIVQSSYGPFGKAALFQPSPGGHVTVSSRSERIFQLLRTDNPVLKILLTSLQTHSQRRKDSGLFAAILSVNLILTGMDLGLPRHKVAMVTSYALSLVAGYLRSEECQCKSKLDLSSVRHMMCLVKSYLTSKTAVCALSNTELNHLASLLLQGFLQVVPTLSESAHVSLKECLHVHAVLGRSVSHSKLFTGLLIEAPEPSFKETVNSWRAKDSRRAEDSQSSIATRRGKDGLIITALFDVSMAGDLEEEYPRELVLSSTSGGNAQVEDAMVHQILSLMEKLVQEGVGFVGCQKCVHPLVKDYLKQQGVVVVDRLSSFNIGSVRDATGGQLISSFSLHYPPQWLGRLKNINSIAFEGKRYYLLEGATAQTSLLLCCKSEVVADELKPLCSATVSVLEQSLQCPYVLYGGGCMETILCYILEQKAVEVSDCTLRELQCDKKTYSCIMRNLVRGFATVALSLEHHGGLILTDSTFHHCWSFPPYDFCEAVHASVVDRNRLQATFATKTCCCGRVSLSGLSTSCKWRNLRQGSLQVLPEVIEDLLIGGKLPGNQQVKRTEATSMNSTAASLQIEEKKDLKMCIQQEPLPCTVDSICNPFLSKLEAIELAGDLSSAILRITQVVMER